MPGLRVPAFDDGDSVVVDISAVEVGIDLCVRDAEGLFARPCRTNRPSAVRDTVVAAAGRCRIRVIRLLLRSAPAAGRDWKVACSRSSIGEPGVASARKHCAGPSPC